MTESSRKQMSNEERMELLNAAVAQEASQQEAELVTDYDEALKEFQTQNKPHKIRFKGQVFEIPHAMPFPFAMFYMRHCIKNRGGKTMFEIPDDKLGELIEKMFGKKFLEILDRSDDVELEFVLNKLVPDIMKKWGQDVDVPTAATEPKNS